MARQASSQPTEVELQILRILWADGPSIARHIHESLQEFKRTTYSTTVKMLSVMLEKGLLKRDDGVRPQVYRPAAPQQRTQKRMLGELIEKVYDGSAATMMLHALSSKQASPEELAEIRKLLDEMEGTK
ncbi:BlaI/MecI/CopY family transcriptional regulator [Roseiconus nitratireducens]|uniref:BlaI/MecI/CopY family transcriptional regulator n=1 Tax=Roseiconus nitratireducens TaxID=2605748 RepID=A0A5M6D1F6_9BACT|nr:BlaI/MecI/CopY family transcriptional regulator [Roseiconus nitratireducens]KAA5539469.1 BlaI/MecI/CopY family transcriptional regulator [Roseiconus nitratireducens]